MSLDKHNKSHSKKVDKRRRIDLAGETIIQKTAIGKFEITYDDFGYVIETKKL